MIAKPSLLVAGLALALGAAVFLVASPSARADLGLEALGSANVIGGDTVRARARALDDAFRQAVDQAVATLVAAPEREARAEVIRKRILRQARGYVSQYRIVDEGEADGVYHLRLEATVATGRLASDLGVAGVALLSAATEPAAAAPPQAPARPRVALVAVTRVDTHAYATFGSTPDGRAGGGGPFADALGSGISGLGFELAPTAGLAPPVASGATPSGFPLDEGQAAGLARAVRAGAVVLAGVEIRDGGPIRMTNLVGAEAEATVLILDVTAPSGPVPLGRAHLTAAGFGAESGAAALAAAHELAQRVSAAVAPLLIGRWPLEKALPPGVTVVMRRVRDWAPVAEYVRALSTSLGAGKVRVRGFARSEVVLQVDAPAAPAVAEVLRTAVPVPLTSAVAAPGAAVSVATPPAVRVATTRRIEVELPATAEAAPTSSEGGLR